MFRFLTLKKWNSDVSISNFVFYTMENELQALNFEYIHKKGNESINYRKHVTSLYNGYPKTVVYCWVSHSKKVNPH